MLRVQRYTWGSVSCEPRDALGGRNGDSLEMTLQAFIECTNKCTLGKESSECGDAL